MYIASTHKKTLISLGGNYVKTTVMAKASDVERKWYVVDAEIVINAEKVKFTGKKLTDKTYFRHSGYQGGTTFTTAGQMLQRFPTRVIEHAVKGMLPKNSLGAQMFRKLNVYVGAEHPHAAQKPEPLSFDIR